mgnify:CR=1 FL=1
MAGRPRKAVGVSKGKIGKEKQLNRKIQESKIKVDRLQLEADVPEWLSPEAAEEYMRIVREAGITSIVRSLPSMQTTMIAIRKQVPRCKRRG